MNNSLNASPVLNQRFSMYMNQLAQRGCPRFIVSAFENARKEVLRFVSSEVQIHPDNIPFLPVIGPVYRTIYDLMSMVRSVREVGFAGLDAAKISDFDHQGQAGLSFIFDVNIGDTLRALDPIAAQEYLLRGCRATFNVYDAMSLCTHTNTLEHHYIWAPMSYYNLSDTNNENHRQIPIIFLSNGIRPKLWYCTPALYRQYDKEVQTDKFGMPSYAKKLKIRVSP